MRDSNVRELDGQPRKDKGWKCCVWGSCSGGARRTVVAVEKLCAVYRTGQVWHLGLRSGAED